MSECPYCKDKPDEKDARMHPYGGSCMHVRWDISPWGSGHCLPPFGDDSYGERSAEGEWLGAHYLSVCRTEHWVHFAIVSDAGGPPSAVARACRDCAATLGAFLTDENRPKERCRNAERNIAAMLERMRRGPGRRPGGIRAGHLPLHHRHRLGGPRWIGTPPAPRGALMAPQGVAGVDTARTIGAHAVR